MFGTGNFDIKRLTLAPVLVPKFIRAEVRLPEVGKFEVKFKSTTEVGKWLIKLETSVGSYQLRWVLSNFARFFSISLSSFQLKQKLSNFRLSNFSFFPTALSNFTYPDQTIRLSWPLWQFLSQKFWLKVKIWPRVSVKNYVMHDMFKIWLDLKSFSRFYELGIVMTWFWSALSLFEWKGISIRIFIS